MVKTVQDNTITIFDNGIYDKGVKAKEVKQKYNDLTDRIKQLNAKITYYQNNDEFAEATKLKRLQSDLEQELMEVDAQLNSSDYKVTDEEFNQFYDSYKAEMSEFEANHQKLAKEMNKKLEEVADVYQAMIENKNEAGRRISRERYVKQEKNNPGNIHNQYKGQMLDHEINLGDGNKYDEQTTPRGYAWKLEKALDAVSRDEFQKYHYGKKQW
jgi:vacuolar-type H+-ATPase subunit I/STV1